MVHSTSPNFFDKNLEQIVVPEKKSQEILDSVIHCVGSDREPLFRDEQVSPDSGGKVIFGIFFQKTK